MTEQRCDIVRVDRVTQARFPEAENLLPGEAIAKAYEQTQRSKPNGDLFLVVQGENVYYNPEEEL